MKAKELAAELLKNPEAECYYKEYFDGICHHIENVKLHDNLVKTEDHYYMGNMREGPYGHKNHIGFILQ